MLLSSRKVLVSRIFEDQFTSPCPCPCPRALSFCPVLVLEPYVLDNNTDYTLQVSGYVLIVGNNIGHLSLTSLRVIRGKSLIDVQVPRYATTTTAGSATTTPTSRVYDDGGLKPDVWNTSMVYEDVDSQNSSVEDAQTVTWTTTSGVQVDERKVPCSLFVASNAKMNSKSIGLKEIHLMSLHGQ